MRDPLVSVIIPAYNSADTIERALRTVLDQTYRNFEIIIVNDGSTDNLEDVLMPYGLKMVGQANEGAAAARNHGARIAKGKFLAFLDADDFWHPDKLRLQVSAMQQHSNARYCVTGSRHIADPEQDAVAQCSKPKENPDINIMDFPRVFENPYFGTPGVLMPREIFDSVGGFNEKLMTAEDVDLWLRAAYGGVVVKIDEVLFYVVGGGLSLRFIDRTYADNIRVIEKFCKDHPKFAESHITAVRKATARVYCDWGSGALSRGDFSLAREKFSLSIKSKLTPRAVYLLGKSLLLLN